ncbi:MAG: ATP-grasp domain-containing protein [Bryobacteraceae bacterium]|nr:ATP-grasp domain-containing protein [Bryobacteraceae bacterium]
MPKILLATTTTGYQTQAFLEAARRLGVEVVVASDRCHVLENPWGDSAIPFEGGAIPHVDGVVALGDKAARYASTLGLRFHSHDAVEAATDKRLTRERFRAAELRVPQTDGLPCVVKPVGRSASQGVIRADTESERAAAIARVRRLVGNEPILVERFIPGHEFALEGFVTRGRLSIVAMFDKPDPLDGPYFEETIYEVCDPVAEAIEDTQRAVTALGLSDGPVHAEMRINGEGVWMLEVAPRPIGGLCAKIVPGLEEAVIQHALTGEAPPVYRGPSAAMMIPVGEGGMFRGVSGVEEASRHAEVVITAQEGQVFRAWPEGSSYPGFLFAPTAARLREAHTHLKFDYAKVLA